jgi:Ni/Fe-hydrogenase 1 B-type cytochrome subunit
LRLIHAWNSVAVSTLIVTGLIGLWIMPGAESAKLHGIHVLAGEALVLGLVARLVWGIDGPAHARWRELWQPACWADTLKRGRFFTPPELFGHHGPATAAYLVTYLMLTGLAFCGFGLLAVKHGVGPLSGWLGYEMTWKAPLMMVHEGLAYGVMAFVLVHLLALIGHQRIHGVPMARSMIDGYQTMPNKQ